MGRYFVIFAKGLSILVFIITEKKKKKEGKKIHIITV